MTLVCNFWRCPALTSIRFIDGTYPIIRAIAGLRQQSRHWPPTVQGRYPEIDANHPFGETGFERAKQVALVTYDEARGGILDFLCVSFLNTYAATYPSSVSSANRPLSLQ
jgi:hypothetical protein